jgi:tRNA U34 5-carboxymethylaminomethyl modifying GTPase MnmE/TrmE
MVDGGCFAMQRDSRSLEQHDALAPPDPCPLSGRLFTIHDSPFTIPVATKCDLLPEQKLAGCLARLNELLDSEFLAVSAKTGAGLDRLRVAIDAAIVSWRSPSVDRQSSILLTARHRQAVAEAIQNISEVVDELSSGNDEVAVMLLRAAYQCICDIHQPVAGRLDEQILQQIFSRFCIGK